MISLTHSSPANIAICQPNSTLSIRDASSMMISTRKWREKLRLEDKILYVKLNVYTTKDYLNKAVV